MSVYQYKEPSAIDQVAIRKSAGGGTRAFLFGRDGIDSAKTQQIKKTLNDAHLCCVASEVDGRHCLEVRGCKDIKVLEKPLKSAGLLKGNSTVDHSDNEKYTLKEKIGNNMQAIYGFMTLAADAGILAYGHLKQKLSPSPKESWEDKAAAYAYVAGSATFTAFGRGDKSDFHARDIALQLRKELHTRGIELSGESAAVSFSNFATKQGALKKSKSYLAKHSAEVGNALTGAAGALIMKGALKSDVTETKVQDGLLGLSTAVAGFGAAIVKEKKADPEHPATTTLGKVKEWVQERPNRLAGYGYMISTVMHGSEAVSNYRNADKRFPGKGDLARKAYLLRGLFAASNMLAEFVLAAASKGHGSGVKSNQSIEDTAIALVADAIVRQPTEKRDALIVDLSQKFLANPEVLGGETATLRAKLYERVHRLQDNPWMSNKAVAAAPAQDAATTKWADNKVKQVVGPAKEKADSFLAGVEKTRAQVSETSLA